VERPSCGRQMGKLPRLVDRWFVDIQSCVDSIHSVIVIDNRAILIDQINQQ
jgi:hypothetical protein